MWDVKDDGSIQVVVEEYQDQVSDPKTGTFRDFKGLLKKEQYIIENDIW
jgi:hypothetical protein